MTAGDPVAGVDTYVENRKVPLGDLVPFPGNANRGDVVAIRASIARTGQYRALVVREQDDGLLVVLAGNNTLEALRAEGRTHARCEIHRCDDATALRINIADNKIARLSYLDEDDVLEQLSMLDGDYDGTGWSEGEVLHLLDLGGGPPDDGHQITATTADVDDLSDVDDEHASGPDAGDPVDQEQRNDEPGPVRDLGLLIVCRDGTEFAELREEMRARGFTCSSVAV